MPRRFLTAEFVDNITPPASGEIWIADTEIRGFGLRVWASRTPDFKAFAIRKNDRDGRTVRKSFQPWAHHSAWTWSWDQPKPEDAFDADGRIRLGSFVKAARRWAKHEIDIIVGRELSDAVHEELAAEHKRMRKRIGAVLRRRTLGHLVETMLTYGEFRGWTENYRDRLMHAFNLFDPADAFRSRQIADLADGELAIAIANSNLTPSNLRLLRSLLNPVFRNLHDLGGPPAGRMLPDRLPARVPRFERDELFEFVSHDKLRDLLEWLRGSDANWRARSAIALTCHSSAPVSRILSARWSAIVDDRWYPYRSGEQRYAWAKADRITQTFYDWLLIARKGADRDGVMSDFWFPRLDDPSRPISSVDHVWSAAVQQLGWPSITLSDFSKHARKHWIGFKWPDQSQQDKIAALMVEWPGTRKTKSAVES
jgi:hypothetical protein